MAEINTEKQGVKGFKERIAEVRPTRWVRFSLVSLIFFLWVAWLGNWWVGLCFILLFDIYITGYIPFTWWKSAKSAAVRKVMSWVDAIVYALILVYFVFAFIGQNYQIPSSSLEKSLLVGDYLWVNKMAYGPRVPMTPIHFPLVQNQFPWGSKSYLDNPQWEYHRLKGLGKVERGDIVVFNFPAGDTVALKMQNPDYYTLCKLYGRDAVWNNPDQFGQVVWRPVDRRENYVKRAVGLPGERLSIKDGVVYINGDSIPQPENVQFRYWFQLKDGVMSDNDWEQLGVAVDDRGMLNYTLADKSVLNSYGFNLGDDTQLPPIYLTTLTPKMVAQLKASGRVQNIDKFPITDDDLIFPEVGARAGWTHADYGEVWIPKKGATLKLDKNAWEIYGRTIRVHEGNPTAEMRDDGRVYIDGKPVDYYTFKMDYYYMMGDNRDNSLDSRYWGFVPEDHIVGRPELILVSFDKDKSLLNGGLRWNRILRSAHVN